MLNSLFSQVSFLLSYNHSCSGPTTTKGLKYLPVNKRYKIIAFLNIVVGHGRQTLKVNIFINKTVSDRNKWKKISRVMRCIVIAEDESHFV